jgi:hypothetical protein
MGLGSSINLEVAQDEGVDLAPGRDRHCSFAVTVPDRVREALTRKWRMMEPGEDYGVWAKRRMRSAEPTIGARLLVLTGQARRWCQCQCAHCTCSSPDQLTKPPPPQQSFGALV